MSEDLILQNDWIPTACTLPTLERPLRRAEFDDLFADDVLSVELTSAHELRLGLRPGPEIAARAARLAVQESGCCVFFTFDLTIVEGRVAMVVSTTSEHEQVLAALAARALDARGGQR